MTSVSNGSPPSQFHTRRTVGCGGPCYLKGSDDSRVGFCSYVRFVTVPTLRTSFASVTSLGIDHRDRPACRHPTGDPPLSLPLRVGFHILADHHPQQTHCL